MMRLKTLLVLLVVCGALSTFDLAKADYQCYATVCGQTWRNNYTSQQCVAVSYQGCYQGTWSATMSGQPYKLYIEEHGWRYEWCGFDVPCWTEHVRYYSSAYLTTGLSTEGANYDALKQHRTWAYHTEFSTGCGCGGTTSDGY